MSQGKPALQENDAVLRAKDRGRGVVLRGRKRKASLTSKEVSYINGRNLNDFATERSRGTSD